MTGDERKSPVALVREPGRRFVMQVRATTTPDCDANSANCILVP
jgi:hypothetical protein